ncbi:MAG TPA: TolC family protein [Candidatus Sulfotelmatobacter sp.]|jgi:outer membrane protein TolC
MRAAVLMLAPIFALAQSTVSIAPPPANVMQLSMKRAVEIALTPEGSPRVALASESVKQAQQQIREAKSAFLPTVDGSIKETSETVNLKTFGINFPSVPGFVIPSFVGPFSVFDTRATAQQSIFSFSDIRKYQASRAAALATASDLGATRNQVSDQVARAYVACLRADAALETAQANVDLSNALLKLANQEKEAGTGTGIEITRAQVQLANDQQRLIVADNDRRKAVLQLLRAMGLNLDANVAFTDKLAYTAVDVATLEASLEQARKQRAELQAQQQHEKVAQLNYSSVSAERLPSAAAFGDYGVIGLAPDSSRPTRDIGIQVKVPLFNGFRREAERAESLSQYRQEKTRTHDLEQQIELDVRLALDNLRSAKAEIQTAEDGLVLAQNEVAQAQRRYQAGVTNSVEVTDAQTRLQRARDNRIAALYDYNLARIDLATATGTITEYVNQ